MLMRFDPFAEFDRWARQMAPERRTTFLPVDAYRTEDKFWLHIDIPGVDQDAIDLQVEDHTLTVRVERSWTTDSDAAMLMNERPQGTFTRQFYLGEGLDTEKIEAGYDHGVLTIAIPVAEQARARKIMVGASDKALTS